MLYRLFHRRETVRQYVEHTEGVASDMFKAVCKLGLEGIVS
jgi:ATP-dependent DNA ligase